MDAQIESHLPLITHRIIFATKTFPPPSVITARMEFPGIAVSHRDFTPPLATPRREKTQERELSKTPTRHQERELPVTFDGDADLRALSPLTEDSEEEREDDSSQNGLIKKKPRGGSGRPGGKGYNLQNELDWSERTYESVVSLVHRLVQAKLDPTKSFRSQDQKEVKRICEKVTKEYSFLCDYENHWPIRDMLISRLKYTSEASRRKDTQLKTKQVEMVLSR